MDGVQGCIADQQRPRLHFQAGTLCFEASCAACAYIALVSYCFSLSPLIHLAAYKPAPDDVKKQVSWFKTCDPASRAIVTV